MSEKPRHIRDIAHLFLSQTQPEKTPGEVREIAVSACGAGCIPGFHVANLSVALSVSGFDVHVIELSGLLPDAAFFLALPPEIYLARPDGEDFAGASALRGVTVHYSDASFTRSQQARPTAGRGTLVIVHLPPFHGDRFADAWAGREKATSVLFLTDATDDGTRALPETMSRRVVLRVDPEAEPHTAAGVIDAGVVTHWPAALTDPVPAVIRDPSARLARTYMAAGEKLVARVTPIRREHERATRRFGTAAESRRAETR